MNETIRNVCYSMACTCEDILIGDDIAFIVGKRSYWFAFLMLMFFVFLIGLFFCQIIVVFKRLKINQGEQ